MNGAVIWSCARRRKVIVWCEDGGELAYAAGRDAIAGTAFPEVGDLVALRVADAGAGKEEGPDRAGQEFRRAEALRVVERGHFAEIVGMLSQGGKSDLGGTGGPGTAPSEPCHSPARPRLKLLA